MNKKLSHPALVFAGLGQLTRKKWLNPHSIRSPSFKVTLLCRITPLSVQSYLLSGSSCNKEAFKKQAMNSYKNIQKIKVFFDTRSFDINRQEDSKTYRINHVKFEKKPSSLF